MNRLLNVNRLKMSSTRHSCDRHAVISQMWRHHPCRHLYDCRQLVHSTMLVWRSGSALVLINNVDLHQARLVLRWVTMSGFSSRCRTFISLCNQWPGQLSLAIPSWVGAMSTSQRAVMPCGWGVKAGMIRVWMADWQVKL